MCTSRPHSSQFRWQDPPLKSSHVLGSGCPETSCVRRICEEPPLGPSPQQHLPLDQELHWSSGSVLVWVMPVPNCWSWSLLIWLPHPSGLVWRSLDWWMMLIIIRPAALLWVLCIFYDIRSSRSFTLSHVESLICLEPFKWLGGLGGHYKIDK